MRWFAYRPVSRGASLTYLPKLILQAAFRAYAAFCLAFQGLRKRKNSAARQVRFAPVGAAFYAKFD